MKLYWRYKKDGKWTWKPATKTDYENPSVTAVWNLEGEDLEEEE
jgi:hypothetical protein